jgi:transcriptional regulator with XRE-family HTH domain
VKIKKEFEERKMAGILGTKLRKERESTGLSQQELSKAVGLSRAFISSLELGRSMPSIESLTSLAAFFKKDLSYFLKEKEDTFSVLLQEEELDKKGRKELRRFKKYCEDYLYLEELTGRRLELGPFYTSASAERLAEEERRRLGSGAEPIRDIFSLLELNGLHILRLSIPERSNISGVFIFLEAEKAAFALINSGHSLEEQALIAAHEYCHCLVDRNAGPIIDNPDVFIQDFVSLYHPRERFAQTFAVWLLTPPRRIKEIIDKDLQSRKLSFADILYLRHYFGVSTSAMLQMLENLGYLAQSKVQEYLKLESADYDIFSGKTREMRGFIRKKGGVILSSRFKSLALEAYQRKKLPAERLQQLLGQGDDRSIHALGKLKLKK